MAEAATLVLQKRTQTGTASSRRLRRQGLIPGNIYGHGQAPVAVCAPAEQIAKLVEQGTRVLDAQIDGVTDQAIFREVQWDVYGLTIQHFDLLRVSADERVTVEVPVDLRGISPGIQAGGILNHHLHTVTVECSAIQIPEAIVVRMGGLEIGHAVHVRELELPEGVKVLNAPDDIVVQVTAAGPAVEIEAAPTEVALEPELIGRRPAATQEGEA